VTTRLVIIIGLATFTKLLRKDFFMLFEKIGIHKTIHKKDYPEYFLLKSRKKWLNIFFCLKNFQKNIFKNVFECFPVACNKSFTIVMTVASTIKLRSQLKLSKASLS
jgi:hypothetical protein